MNKKVLIQVRCEFSLPHLNWLPNWQVKNKEALSYLKGSPRMGGRWIFSKNLRDSFFNDDLLNEPNFSQIHLAEQYL